ncbi:unnamed protein product [Cuscuta campestris]|uniref:Uncharacterized protein n=1 Tax=Cuscuta campestris TaxID=132261 RepID=A0A484LIT7_9ASTE|nr:unnamed protein product [Cuscuta campestris]
MKMPSMKFRLVKGWRRSSSSAVKCGDDVEMHFDAGGPSFDLLTPMPKGDPVGDDNPTPNSGNVSVTKAFDAEKQSKFLDIPYIETQYDPRELEHIDKETGLMISSFQKARNWQAPLVSFEEAMGKDADAEKCNVVEDGDAVDLNCENATVHNDVQEAVGVEAAVGERDPLEDRVGA